MVSLVLTLCLTLPIFFLFFFQYRKTLKKPPFPPGPRALPIIGNLHHLNNSPFYAQLRQLSYKYGPLFSLQLGLRPAIVVSSPTVVKKVLKDHDIEFCGRPLLHGQRRMSYDGMDVAFGPYCSYWKEIRKFCVVNVLSPMRVSTFSTVRHQEIKQLIKKISMQASSSKVTNLSEAFMSLTSTIICRIAFGRRYEKEGAERSRFHDLFNECQIMLGTLFFTDYSPYLGWIDKFTRKHARLEQNFKEMDKFYQEVIDEHMDPNRKTPDNQDLIDVLLQLKKQRAFYVDLTYDHIKAVIMNILVAATDTTTSSTVWAMTALLKNPKMMKKVQDEIRNLGGKKDFLNEDDIQKFPYFKAVIKETLRMYPPAPIVYRETTEPCTIDGYEIPVKTLVIVNNWAIHKDPTTWKDPDEFIPERWLDSTIDFRGQDSEYIPFGIGRRTCPGMPMALASLDLILANLLNSFDWELPAGMKAEDIDTEMLQGLTQHKKNALCALAKHRI